MNTEQYNKSQYKNEIKGMVKTMESLRKNPNNPTDVNLSEFVKKRFDISLSALLDDVGVDVSFDTIENLFTLPDESVRWLLPEIIREALRLGLRKAPIWNDLIAAEQSVKQTLMKMPHWNMSDATPKILGQAETIPVGTVSFGEKSVTIGKMGRGIKIPYEVKQYVAINIVALYLQDFGIKLGQGLDTMLIDVLINGEQLSGSESAPTVGVAAPGTLAYKDLLKVWVRLSRIGRSADAMIGGEDIAIDILDLTEFKTRNQVGTTAANLNFKTPIPKNTNFYVHGAVPADQAIVIDSSSAIIKLNAQPLVIESDKIISNQTLETYATLTTGFAVIYRDARVVIDRSLNFVGNGFPAYMDVDSAEVVVIE